MSAILGQNINGTGGLAQQTDDRTVDKSFQWDYAGTRSQLDPFQDGMLWTRSRMGLGGTDGFFGLDFSSSGVYETHHDDCAGGQQTKKIIGTTLDASGSSLGNCIVQGFVTATNAFVGQVTSDPGGYYELPTTNTGTHYLVAYKPGAPDVAGTSADTIVPV